MRHAPSRIENSEWTWRWTNDAWPIGRGILAGASAGGPRAEESADDALHGPRGERKHRPRVLSVEESMAPRMALRRRYRRPRAPETSRPAPRVVARHLPNRRTMLAPDPGFVEIDGLDPHEFELALVELFELLGGVTEWCLDNPWRHGGKAVF